MVCSRASTISKHYVVLTKPMKFLTVYVGALMSHILSNCRPVLFIRITHPGFHLFSSCVGMFVSFMIVIFKNNITKCLCFRYDFSRIYYMIKFAYSINAILTRAAWPPRGLILCCCARSGLALHWLTASHFLVKVKKKRNSKSQV